MSYPLGWCAPAKAVGDAFVGASWITASCYVLASLLIILGLIALLLVALELTSSKRRHEWKLRPIACGLLAVTCLVEALFFISFPGRFWRNKAAYYALSQAPQVLLSCALFLCTYLFGSIFHDVYFQGILSDMEIALRRTRRAKLQFGCSIGIGVVQIILYAVSFTVDPSTYEPIQSYWNAFLGIGAGLSFPVYLGYLLRKRFILSKEKARVMYQHRLLQCWTVAMLGSVCSLARGILALFWQKLSTAFSRQLYWVFVVCSYSLTDLLPIAFMLILFKVVSFQATWFVGTADAGYWKTTREKNVSGHDFNLILASDQEKDRLLLTDEEEDASAVIAAGSVNSIKKG